MIRISTDKESLEIINEPQNVKRLGFPVERFLYQPFIAESDGAKMMFVFWPVDSGVIEVHIASKKDSILKSRVLAIEILEWLFKHGAEKVVTSCPEGKIANMARKLGMKQYKEDGETRYFEVKSWL